MDPTSMELINEAHGQPSLPGDEVSALVDEIGHIELGREIAVLGGIWLTWLHRTARWQDADIHDIVAAVVCSLQRLGVEPRLVQSASAVLGAARGEWPIASMGRVAVLGCVAMGQCGPSPSGLAGIHGGQRCGGDQRGRLRLQRLGLLVVAVESL